MTEQMQRQSDSAQQVGSIEETEDGIVVSLLSEGSTTPDALPATPALARLLMRARRINLERVRKEVDGWIQEDTKTKKEFPSLEEKSNRELLTVWFNAWIIGMDDEIAQGVQRPTLDHLRRWTV
jgi:transketolase C-terminal domain/subunit